MHPRSTFGSRHACLPTARTLNSPRVTSRPGAFFCVRSVVPGNTCWPSRSFRRDSPLSRFQLAEKREVILHILVTRALIIDEYKSRSNDIDMVLFNLCKIITERANYRGNSLRRGIGPSNQSTESENFWWYPILRRGLRRQISDYQKSRSCLPQYSFSDFRHGQSCRHHCMN